MNLIHSGRSFSEIHDAGARDFAEIWFGVNKVAVDAFLNCGVDPRTPEMAKALSLAVYRILEDITENRKHD